MTYRDAVNALATGAFVPAITTFLGRVAHDRTDGEAWMYLGIAYSGTGHQDEALRALSTADLLLDDNAELQEAFGCTYLRLKQYKRARSYLEGAIRCLDCPASVYRNLAVVFLKTGDLPAALMTIDTSLEMDPDDVLTLYCKALILVETAGATDQSVEDELRIVLNNITRRPGVPPAILNGVKTLAALVSDVKGSSRTAHGTVAQ
ncbi:MAG: tetratricopeptide repeat protein [Spirochaetales bacterium]|nr:tetratricopeptide repeat protein [Spirochaetales bacterium]